MDTTTALLLALMIGLLLGGAIGALWSARRRAPDAEVLAAAGDRAVVRDGLGRLQDQLTALDHNRASWEGTLAEQVSEVRRATDSLRRETSSLSTALRKPQVRGRWGELQLRRTVELAGMLDHCDFTEQSRLDDGARRPDLVVHLAGGRSVVVDAKVPLEAFLDATAAGDPEDAENAENTAEQTVHLQRHAKQVRAHIDGLSGKRYWRSLPGTPEFVVMFLPAEAALSAALETDRDLIEYAAARGVVLATPTTLIALLRTVAHGWVHEALTDRAQEILDLGRELHDRLGIVSGHLDKLGRSLDAAVTAFNRTVGSWESRVAVTTRRFAELQPTLGAGGEPATPRQVETLARTVSENVSPIGVRRAVDPIGGDARHAEGCGSDDEPDARRTLAQ